MTLLATLTFTASGLAVAHVFARTLGPALPRIAGILRGDA